MMVELRAHIPELQRWQRWWRMYASTQSGLSWEAFFHSTRHEAPTLLVVQAMDGQIFGAFCTAPWEKQKGFYGSVDGGQCFLWRAVRDTVEVFHWQLVNRHFQMSDGTGLGIGGGGTDFGLYIAGEWMQQYLWPSYSLTLPQIPQMTWSRGPQHLAQRLQIPPS
jgi:hypothetical protein